MTMPVRTSAVCQRLGVTYYRLFYLIRAGRIPAPAKDNAGTYCWSEEDVRRAAAALRRARGPL